MIASVTIVTDPKGTPVNGSNNTFDYPILISVSLMCMATTACGSSVTASCYSWTVTDSYNHTIYGVQNSGFYSGGCTGYNITGNSLLAPDAGTVTCTATIDGIDYTSDPLTLRISGEPLYSQYTVWCMYTLCMRR